MRIVLVGGGTGGHFYPLIAIAEAIRDRDTALVKKTELFYMGPTEYNRESLARLNIRYTYCPAGKRRNYFSLLNFFDIFVTLFGVFFALCKLYRLYPDVVMSKGGFTSVPVVFAARLLRIPIVIHESDATPGKANKFAARYARYIGISYDDAAEFFPQNKTALTGIPIRKFFYARLPDPHTYLTIPKDRPVLFVVGGSLGAERINNLILDSLDELLPHYTLVHQTGTDHKERVTESAGSLISDMQLLEHYFVFGHMTGEQVAAALQAASLVISRAGSGSIAEIALSGKPSILIPIPEEISHDQRTNAYAYARTGAATVIEEKNLQDAILAPEINRILSDQAVYESMQRAAEGFTREGAAYTLADTLLGIGNEHI